MKNSMLLKSFRFFNEKNVCNFNKFSRYLFCQQINDIQLISKDTLDNDAQLKIKNIKLVRKNEDNNKDENEAKNTNVCIQSNKEILKSFNENLTTFSYKNNVSYKSNMKSKADNYFFKSEIKLIHYLDDRNINDFKKGIVENNYELYDVYKGIPEILILGRSNVGKSSLINCLFSKDDVTSPNKTPGKTQKLEFYIFGTKEKPKQNKNIYTKMKHICKMNPKGIIIDAPGFGFIKAPVALKKKFKYLIYTYLNFAVRLNQIIYLLNGEYGMNSIDMKELQFLNQFNKTIQLVFTKIDNLNDKNVIKYVTEASNFTRDLKNVRTEILLTSSKTNFGIRNLRAHLYLDIDDFELEKTLNITNKDDLITTKDE